MLNIPNTTPIIAGKTKNSRLNILSADKDSPASEDSKIVSRMRNKTDSKKSTREVVPRFNFIKILASN